MTDIPKKGRIYLRTLEHADVTQRYLDWFRNDSITSFLEVAGKSLTTEMVCAYMDKGKNDGTYFMQAICLTDGDLHIGNLKIGPIIQKHMISDLVCVIGDVEYWGKGLATEAIALGNEIAFEKYNVRKLHGQIYANNVGSIKAYCRAGWIVEGVVRGRYLVDNEAMDQVMVSCNNPKYIPSKHNDYNISELKRFQEFIKTI